VLSSTFRFGIIGCGTIGPTHAGAIARLAGARLIAVADPISERAQSLKQKFGADRVYASGAELVADPDIDIVCLCTPSGMHGDGAVEAMLAGKHVIVEKPMEISLTACDRMIAAAHQTGKKLTVISQHRFDAASAVARTKIAAGELGDIVLATADVKWWRTQAYYDSGDWRGTWAMDGGGALMNQGVHTVDLLQWLAGPVKSVYAQARTSAHQRIEVEDAVVATVTFARGGIGTIVASTAAYPGLAARVDLFGTRGSLSIDGDVLRLLAIQGSDTLYGKAAAAHAVGVAQGGTARVKDEARQAAADPGAVWGDAHYEQFADFVAAIAEDRPPLITAEDARKPVEIILAIYESARTGKVVEIASAL
jgi:predicted dehydrogenase